MLKKNKVPSWGMLFALFLALFSFNAFAQKAITGKITGVKDNQPLLGATISVKGTTIGTQTDADGSFSITVPNDKSILVISAVGFETAEVSTSGKTSVSLQLKDANSSLNEVVVTGYTSQRKKDITGAVTVVNVGDLKSVPSADASSQLQGRASGVTIVQSGVPGAAASVRIRGLGSFQNNNPLYVIDGVQSSSISDVNPNDIESMQVLKDAASSSIYGVRASNGVVIITTKKGKKKGVNVSYDMFYGSQDPGKGLKMLTAQEEAELAFLARKNSGQATTGSAYGNGATPVLPDYLYFTGGPTNGTPILNGNAGVAASKYTLDYGKLGDPNGYSPYIIVPASKQGTDWYDAVTRNAPIQNHNLTMSGANEGSRFMLSLNYYNQEAITKYQFYKKYTARLNSEFNVLSNVRVGENLQLYSSEANIPPSTGGNFNNSEGSIIAQTFRPMAIVPVYTIKDGDFAGNIGGSGWGTWGNAKNPLAQLYRTRNDRNNNLNLFGNVYGEIDFIKSLTFRTSFGGSINNNTSFSYPFIEYENSENVGNSTYNEGFRKNNNWIWTNQLNFKKTLGDHNINILVGQEAQKSGGRQIVAASTGYFGYDYQPFINLNNGGVQNLGGSQIFTPGTTLSYFGKIDYAFAGKYLLSATVRRDASSKFLGDNKWGVFPAFSIGWRVSDESFMKNVSWINDMKIRASYGKLGNESALSASNAFTTFGSNRQSSWYDIDGKQVTPQEGFFLNFTGNPNGKWEKSVSANIGFDATLFHGTTDIVFDWYKKNTEDLLYNPSGQGIAGAVASNNPNFRNVGSMSNTGIDLLVSNRAKLSKEVRLNTTFTLTTYKNKITAINNDGQKFFDFNSPANESNRIGANATRNFVGEALNTFYGYQVVGLWQKKSDIDALTAALRAKKPGDTISVYQADAAPGRFRYEDVNGDGQIDSKDRKIIGNPNPKFTYGLNLGVEYKNFDVTAFFYGVVGKDAFNLTRWWTDFMPGAFPGGRSKRALYESWLPDGSRPNATVPIQEVSSGGGFSSNLAVNSYYIEKASYFRLRNFQVGYTLPAVFSSKMKISKLRVYVQATNLFTITKYTGFNPDIISSDDRAASVDVGAYPTVRQYLIGASVNF